MMGETETMLKIFLAEDEIVMREGIRNNIAWQEKGFEFVGEASDGEIAYPMIQWRRKKPQCPRLPAYRRLPAWPRS